MKFDPQKDTNERFLTQARIEVEKARGSFEDVDPYLRRALAIQWILDRNGEDSETGLRDAIQEMIDDLVFYQTKLLDKSGQDYKDLIQAMFFDEVETVFTEEAVDESLKKQGIQ